MDVVDSRQKKRRDAASVSTDKATEKSNAFSVLARDSFLEACGYCDPNVKEAGAVAAQIKLLLNSTSLDTQSKTLAHLVGLLKPLIASSSDILSPPLRKSFFQAFFHSAIDPAFAAVSKPFLAGLRMFSNPSLMHEFLLSEFALMGSSPSPSHLMLFETLVDFEGARACFEQSSAVILRFFARTLSHIAMTECTSAPASDAISASSTSSSNSRSYDSSCSRSDAGQSSTADTTLIPRHAHSLGGAGCSNWNTSTRGAVLHALCLFLLRFRYSPTLARAFRTLLAPTNPDPNMHNIDPPSSFDIATESGNGERNNTTFNGTSAMETATLLRPQFSSLSSPSALEGRVANGCGLEASLGGALCTRLAELVRDPLGPKDDVTQAALALLLLLQLSSALSSLSYSELDGEKSNGEMHMISAAADPAAPCTVPAALSSKAVGVSCSPAASLLLRVLGRGHLRESGAPRQLDSAAPGEAFVTALARVLGGEQRLRAQSLSPPLPAPTLGRLALIRAAMARLGGAYLLTPLSAHGESSPDTSLLLTPTPSSMWPSSATSATTMTLNAPPTSPTTLLAECLPTVLEGCASHAAAERLYAFQALRSWLDAALTLWAECDGTGSSRANFRAGIKSSVAELPQVASLVHRNWEHPLKILTLVCREVFERYIALVSLVDAPDTADTLATSPVATSESATAPAPVDPDGLDPDPNTANAPGPAATDGKDRWSRVALPFLQDDGWTKARFHSLLCLLPKLSGPFLLRVAGYRPHRPRRHAQLALLAAPPSLDPHADAEGKFDSKSVSPPPAARRSVGFLEGLLAATRSRKVSALAAR